MQVQIGSALGMVTLVLVALGCQAHEEEPAWVISEPVSLQTQDDEASCEDDEPSMVRPEGWTRATHCKGVDADYEYLFPDFETTVAEQVVHRFDIVVEPEVWQEMQDDLDSLTGSGASTGPEDDGPTKADGARKPGGGKGTPGLFFGGREPMWAPVTVGFDGQTWWEVGMRFKGNSSLLMCWAFRMWSSFGAKMWPPEIIRMPSRSKIWMNWGSLEPSNRFRGAWTWQGWSSRAVPVSLLGARWNHGLMTKPWTWSLSWPGKRSMRARSLWSRRRSLIWTLLFLSWTGPKIWAYRSFQRFFF